MFNYYNKSWNFLVVIVCFSIICWLFFLSYFAVPFFKLLCQDTGPNGLDGLMQDLKGKSNFLDLIINFIKQLKLNFNQFSLNSKKLSPTSDILNISVVFKVNDNLDLIFNSPVSSHKVPIGRPELLFCNVTNYSSSDLVFTSIYNVHPPEALPYLEKIQCFCYDDQIVESSQTISLPIYYRINNNFLTDPLLDNVTDLVISYTIFKSN